MHHEEIEICVDGLHQRPHAVLEVIDGPEKRPLRQPQRIMQDSFVKAVLNLYWEQSFLLKVRLLNLGVAFRRHHRKPADDSDEDTRVANQSYKLVLVRRIR